MVKSSAKGAGGENIHADMTKFCLESTFRAQRGGPGVIRAQAKTG